MKLTSRLPGPPDMVRFYMDLQKLDGVNVAAGGPIDPDIGSGGVMDQVIVRPTGLATEIINSLVQVTSPEYDAGIWDQHVSFFFTDDGETLLFYCPDGPEAVIPINVSDPDAFITDLIANPAQMG